MRILLLQGIYYLASGIWPWVHRESFLKVTGPKTDLWLVNTVGGLVTIIGLALISAAVRNHLGREIRILSAGSAIFFAGVEIFYFLSGVISGIYLADALLQLCILGGLIAAFRKHAAAQAQTAGPVEKRTPKPREMNEPRQLGAA